jgi:hypothetical protein
MRMSLRGVQIKIGTTKQSLKMRFFGATPLRMTSKGLGMTFKDDFFK